MLSRWYDLLYKIIRLFRVSPHLVFGTHPELASLVEDGTIEPCRAIDLGCGMGREAVYLASRGFDVTGVDISPTAIDMARRAAEKADVEVEFVVDDVTALSKVSGPFDLIIDYGAFNDLNQEQRDGYVSSILPIASANSQMVLLCFDGKLPQTEVEQRFGSEFVVELIASRGEAGTRRQLRVYLMKHLTDDCPENRKN